MRWRAGIRLLLRLISMEAAIPTLLPPLLRLQTERRRWLFCLTRVPARLAHFCRRQVIPPSLALVLAHRIRRYLLEISTAMANRISSSSEVPFSKFFMGMEMERCKLLSWLEAQQGRVASSPRWTSMRMGSLTSPILERLQRHKAHSR